MHKKSQKRKCDTHSFISLTVWHFSSFSVTLVHEKVWVTDPNHSDRRSTWPQQRKQHQRSAVRRQQQLLQRSAVRRQQLRRQLQSAVRRQQLRRQLQSVVRRQQPRRQLQSAAVRRQQLQQLLQRSAVARRQLRSNYHLEKPATVCGGFFYALSPALLSFIWIFELRVG